MKKYFVIFVISLFIIQFNNVVRSASCDSCDAPNYSTHNPGGNDFGGDVPTDSQCDSICTKTWDGDGSVKFCANGGGALSPIDGEVVLFGGSGSYKVYVNGRNVKEGTFSSDSNGTETGVKVKANDRVGIHIPDALGWRYKTGASFSKSGYTVISKQFLADSCMEGQFDSYDFNDWTLIVTIKKLDCDVNDLDIFSNLGSLSHLILGINKQIDLTKRFNQSSSLYKMYSNDLTTAGAFSNCDWNGLGTTNSTKKITCTIQKKPAYPNTAISWTHKWCNVNSVGNCDGQKICSKTLTINVDPYNSYLRTDSGISYLKGSLSQPRFPTTASPTQYFSTYNFGNGPSSSFNPTSNLWLSSKKYLLLSYNDNNQRSDFFEHLKSHVEVGAKRINKNSNIILGSNYKSTVVEGNDVVIVNGDITIDNTFVCESKTIFFANNLNINSSFTINGDNACLFIIRNQTNVGVNVSNVKAFVISGEFNSLLGSNQLTLKGGVIAQTNSVFNRNINLYVTDIEFIQDKIPSEILDYEGARYIKLLGQFLSEPQTIKIREIQYSGSK